MTARDRKVRRAFRMVNRRDDIDRETFERTNPLPPSRVPMWIRFLLARCACSMLFLSSSLFSVVGVWLSRPGRPCWAWGVSEWLSTKGLGCFRWATGERA